MPCTFVTFSNDTRLIQNLFADGQTEEHETAI